MNNIISGLVMEEVSLSIVIKIPTKWNFDDLDFGIEFWNKKNLNFGILMT